MTLRTRTISGGGVGNKNPVGPSIQQPRCGPMRKDFNNLTPEQRRRRRSFLFLPVWAVLTAPYPAQERSAGGIRTYNLLVHSPGHLFISGRRVGTAEPESN